MNDEILHLKRTSPLHLRAIEAGSSSEVQSRNGTPWLDGNDVEEDLEMARITENALLNQAAVKLLNERFRMYRTLFNRR